MISLKSIADLGPLSGKKVLLRLDFNVPIEKGAIRDPFRIDQSIPTIMELMERGAKVGIVSHIENEEGATLAPVHAYLSAKMPVRFVRTLPELTASLLAASPGDVVLMENVRQYPGEKKGDPAFARELAAVADAYVNDAFSACHRPHASISGVASLLPSVAGPLLSREVSELSKAFASPRPLMILGGAKFDTKLPLIRRFMPRAEAIFVGGALGNDLLKARGFPVGASKLSDDPGDLSEIAAAKNVVAPVDVVVKDGERSGMKIVQDVAPAEAIVDIGPQSAAMLKASIDRAALVVWNGPLGWFEAGFGKGTAAVASALAGSSAHSILGGGDTLAALAPTGLLPRFSFVSTGGGAMLDFLASEGALPGTEPLKRTG